ncbi:MAG: MauE/DoxX family redox-associated membrane protein [Candidatus Kapaibacterium sp.]
MAETSTRQQSGTTSTLNEMHPAMQSLSLAVRILLGVIFLVSGAEKLGALDTFAHAIANYKIIPFALANIFAVLVVWTEIAIAVLLIAGAAVRGTALVTGTLLTVFLIAILTAMARGLEIDCGCFNPAAGVEPEKVGWPKVFEDLALLAGAVFLIYFPKSPLTIDRLLRRQGKEGEEG